MHTQERQLFIEIADASISRKDRDIFKQSFLTQGQMPSAVIALGDIPESQKTEVAVSVGFERLLMF